MRIHILSLLPLLLASTARADPAAFDAPIRALLPAMAARRTVAPAIVLRGQVGGQHGQLEGETTFVFPNATVSEILRTYIGRHPDEYLVGGHLEGQPIYYRKDPRAPGGASRLLPGYLFDKRVPIRADVKQTVIDHGDGSGEIRIEPLSGPLRGGLIPLSLREFSEGGARGTRVYFNLDALTLAPPVQALLRLPRLPLRLAAATLGRVPVLGLPFRAPDAVAGAAEHAALRAVSGLILETASNGPRNLARLIDADRARQAQPR